MERTEIIKALECCFINQNCNGCPMYNGITTQKDCLEVACKNALALIKELQAYNENLKKENKYLRESLADEREHKEDCFFSVDFDIKALKADTVKKMQERLKAKMVTNVLGIKFMILHEEELGQIAKEMLEGTQND